MISPNKRLAPYVPLTTQLSTTGPTGLNGSNAPRVQRVQRAPTGPTGLNGSHGPQRVQQVQRAPTGPTGPNGTQTQRTSKPRLRHNVFCLKPAYTDIAQTVCLAIKTGPNGTQMPHPLPLCQRLVLAICRKCMSKVLVQLIDHH